MSTGRELLELAAKAAGLEYRWDGAVGMMRARLPGSGSAFPGWNPLTDDGDAMRLAVALGISTSPGEVKSSVQWWKRPGMIEQESEVVANGADRYAAMRLAIVLAAAQIGKTNQPGEAG
ncbi:hypothetical protein LJR039_004311 [Pseudorhodoferax sp. LjRoot39]|uniref:hypothetical protein n=1 Tax=Pseudorhodoferax sp. LjRoot39 TaxID=3342328 RepID=UPI003ECF1974